MVGFDNGFNVECDLSPKASQLRTKKLEQSMDRKIKDFGEYAREMIEQVVQAGLKQPMKDRRSYDELKLYFLVMKKEIEECKKYHEKLVIDMSRVHDELSNLQHLPSEMRVHQCETDNHIQRLRGITDALQTNLSTTNGMTTNLNRMVQQTKLDLDVLRLDCKMQAVPSNASLDFHGEVVSNLQTICNDIQSKCNELLLEQNQRQEAKVQALQNTFSVIHGDVQMLDTKLLDTQNVFYRRNDELFRAVIQLDNMRKESWQQIRKDLEKELRVFQTDMGGSLLQQTQDSANDENVLATVSNPSPLKCGGKVPKVHVKPGKDSQESALPRNLCSIPESPASQSVEVGGRVGEFSKLNCEGVVNRLASESLQTKTGEDSSNDTVLKVQKMRGGAVLLSHPTSLSGNSTPSTTNSSRLNTPCDQHSKQIGTGFHSPVNKTNVELRGEMDECIDILRSAFATQVQALQQTVSAQIENIRVEKLCPDRSQNSLTGSSPTSSASTTPVVPHQQISNASRENSLCIDRMQTQVGMKGLHDKPVSEELQTCFEILTKIQTSFGPHLQGQELGGTPKSSNPSVRNTGLGSKNPRQLDVRQVCAFPTYSTQHFSPNSVHNVSLKPGVMKISEAHCAPTRNPRLSSPQPRRLTVTRSMSPVPLRRG